MGEGYGDGGGVGLLAFQKALRWATIFCLHSYLQKASQIGIALQILFCFEGYLLEKQSRKLILGLM